MSNVEQVGEKIRTAIRHARSKGFVIKPNLMRGYWRDKECCCAVGAVVIDTRNDQYVVAGDRLDLGMRSILSIARGFDLKTDKFHPDIPELWELGSQIRKEVESGVL